MFLFKVLGPFGFVLFHSWLCLVDVECSHFKGLSLPQDWFWDGVLFLASFSCSVTLCCA